VEREPLSKQRSKWEPIKANPDAAWERALVANGAELVGIYERRLGDGVLRSIVTRLSVKLTGASGISRLALPTTAASNPVTQGGTK